MKQEYGVFIEIQMYGAITKRMSFWEGGKWVNEICLVITNDMCTKRMLSTISFTYTFLGKIGLFLTSSFKI